MILSCDTLAIIVVISDREKWIMECFCSEVNRYENEWLRGVADHCMRALWEWFIVGESGEMCVFLEIFVLVLLV